MKWLKVFSLFALLHAGAWIGTHVWLAANPRTVLIVADTSFSMKEAFPAMRRWIDERAEGARYTRFLVGTDKALIGPLEELRSSESIFRAAFGRSAPESLNRYAAVAAGTRVLLSDGSFEVPGWELVRFDID